MPEPHPKPIKYKSLRLGPKFWNFLLNVKLS